MLHRSFEQRRRRVVSAPSGYELVFSVELNECLVPDFQAPKIMRRMAAAKAAIRLH